MASPPDMDEDEARIRQGLLTTREFFWRDHYEWLQRSGYHLRPRYAPDWIPSWRGTTKFYRSCEDGIIPRVSLAHRERRTDAKSHLKDDEGYGRHQSRGR